MDAIRERFHNVSSDKERELINAEIRALCDEDAEKVLELAIEQAKETQADIDTYLVRKQMEHILPCV